MSDYQRLHDALVEKGFKPEEDLEFFHMLQLSWIIRNKLMVIPNKKEDKSKAQLKKEVKKLKEEVLRLQGIMLLRNKDG